MFVIPNQETKTHLQDNKSDFSGTILRSRNINLDKEGYIKLSEPSFAVMTTEDDASLDSADAMLASASQVYINSDEVFRGTLDLDIFQNISSHTNSPSPSLDDDVVYFNGTEVVSDGASIFYRSASTTWTTVSTSMSVTAPFVMTAWESEASLVVARGNIVKFISTAWAVSGTILTLPSSYYVTSLSTVGNTLYIATRNLSGGEAKLFTVSTIQVGIEFAFGVGTFEIFTMKPFKSSVICLTSLGQLLYFNGGGFDSLAQLPVYNSDIEWADKQNSASRATNRSMVTDGDLVYMNISSLTENGILRILPNFLSGIWCFDFTNNSLYHRYAPSASKVRNISGSNVTVDTSLNNFTLTSGNLNNYSTGMYVLFDRATPVIDELKESTVYYFIKISSTVFKLATTYANAIAGTAIDISGAGAVGQSWFVFASSDFGWGAYDNNMSMAVLNNVLFDSTRSGRICMTADLYSKQNSATDLTVINGVSPFLPNRGYFVMPKLSSPRIIDEYSNIYVKFKPLKVEDKIIIKYKEIDKVGLPFSSITGNITSSWNGVWTSTTVFTTVVDMSLASVGDEVEIIAGVGSGHMSTISTISLSTGTYTVTLEEAFPFAVSGDVIRFNVDNYKELAVITSTTPNANKNYFSKPIGSKSKFLEIKVEMRGIDVTIEEITLTNKKHIDAI